MDVPQRTKHEQELINKLMALFLLMHDDTFKSGRFVPLAFAELLATEIQPVLARMYFLMFTQVAESVGFDIDVGRSTIKAEIGNQADRWSKKYSETLSRSVARNVRKDIISSKQRGSTSQEAIAEALGKRRATMIGVTEITRAASRGVIDLAGRIRKEKGWKVELIWHTAEDEQVCKVCKPLDEEPEEVWSLEFPAGSPAHPICRCWLEMRVTRI